MGLFPLRKYSQGESANVDNKMVTINKFHFGNVFSGSLLVLERHENVFPFGKNT